MLTPKLELQSKLRRLTEIVPHLPHHDYRLYSKPPHVAKKLLEKSSVFIRFSSIIHKLPVVEDISESLLRVTAIPIDQRGRMGGRRFRTGSGIWMRITEQRVNLRSGSNGFPRISWKREDFFATIVVFASRSFPPSSTYFRGNTAFY